MPRLYNVDHQPHLINPVGDERAVLPGEPYEFSDEQIAAGLAGHWSETDPREGLDDERAFKLARDTSRTDLDEQARQLGIDPSGLASKQAVAEAIVAASADTNPAEPGDKE